MELDLSSVSGLIDVFKLQLITYTPKLLVAVLIYLLFSYIYKGTHKPLEHVLEKSGIQRSLAKILVHNIYHTLLIFMGLMMAASQLGIDVGAALAGLGIAGIAIGFAAQDVLASIIAGFMIFMDKPFKAGDWIVVQDNYGEVTEITIRSTRIRTLNNTFIVIPNKIIVDAVVDNHSMYGATRIEIPIGIAYKESIPQAREVLLKAIADIDGLADDPAPDVVTDELGDSSVNLILRVWTHEAAKEKPIYYAVMEAGKLALDAAKIEIPFPHLQLFVDEVKDKAVGQLQKVKGA